MVTLAKLCYLSQGLFLAKTSKLGKNIQSSAEVTVERNHITKKVQEILKDSQYIYPQNVALASAWIIANFKGFDLKIIEVGKYSALTDFFILGSVTNNIQARAISDQLIRQFRGEKFKLISVEGDTEGDWNLLDFGDIIIHLFNENSRESYNLDNVWKTCPRLEIPAEFYNDGVINTEIEEASENESKGYF